MLLEPHALPLPPKVVFRVVPELLFSKGLVPPANDRGCQAASALSFAATPQVELGARMLLVKAIL
jgi:hypothetical protein